jgi:hypothetical protein
VNSQRANFYVKGNTAEDLKVALAFVLKISAQEHRHALLIWPGFQTFEISTIADVLGPVLIKKLKKDRQLSFGDGSSLKLVTWTAIPSLWEGPVLAVYPNAKTLDKIDGIYSVSHLIVNAWVPLDIEQWCKRWRAVDLDSGQSASPSDDELSPVVVEALKMLTGTVNLSLLHPTDKARSIDIFKRLKSARFKLAPEAIKDWLIRNHWRPEDAEDVRDLVQRLNEGKKVRAGRRMWADDIIQQLKERASSVSR